MLPCGHIARHPPSVGGVRLADLVADVEAEWVVVTSGSQAAGLHAEGEGDAMDRRAARPRALRPSGIVVPFGTNVPPLPRARKSLNGRRGRTSGLPPRYRVQPTGTIFVG
jgi:hypothetical protein